jgi:hypothetical protein
MEEQGFYLQLIDEKGNTLQGIRSFIIPNRTDVISLTKMESDEKLKYLVIGVEHEWLGRNEKWNNPQSHYITLIVQDITD